MASPPGTSETGPIAAAPEEPRRRVVLGDQRGDARRLRVTWHVDEGQFVISHWRGDVCVAAVRLDPGQARELAAFLAAPDAGLPVDPRPALA
jgi:hypothetical protein